MPIMATTRSSSKGFLRAAMRLVERKCAPMLLMSPFCFKLAWIKAKASTMMPQKKEDKATSTESRPFRPTWLNSSKVCRFFWWKCSEQLAFSMATSFMKPATRLRYVRTVATASLAELHCKLAAPSVTSCALARSFGSSCANLASASYASKSLVASCNMAVPSVIAQMHLWSLASPDADVKNACASFNFSWLASAADGSASAFKCCSSEIHLSLPQLGFSSASRAPKKPRKREPSLSHRKMDINFVLQSFSCWAGMSS